NRGEPAATAAPGQTETSGRRGGPAWKRNPIARQQPPLTASAAEATAVRPTRSASSPAATHPAAPAPSTRKDAVSAHAAGAPVAAKLARIMTGAQVHIA